jgi:hypothetical protein
MLVKSFPRPSIDFKNGIIKPIDDEKESKTQDVTMETDSRIKQQQRPQVKYQYMKNVE